VPAADGAVLDDEAVDNRMDGGSAMSALEVRAAVKSASLLIGFHADQATEACVDLAMRLGVPFAICPCCVFPLEFPDRHLPDGRFVSK
jgi:hypothetical protein